MTTTWSDLTSKTTRSSRYMSDELCHAIVDYNALLESKEGHFENLVSQQEELREDLRLLNNQMFDLQFDLSIIEDKLDMAKGMNEDTTELNEQKDSKLNEINLKQSEIDQVQTSVSETDEAIKDLQNEIAIENNFTPELIAERDQYIIERTWSDTNYIDDKELLMDAQKKFIELKQPKTTFDLDIVDFLQILEEQHNWDKLKIGDVVNIRYEYIGVNIKAKITEINFNYDNQTISIGIANVTDLHGDAKNLLKLLKQSASTSKTLELNKYKYDEVIDRTDSISDIIEGTWDAAKRRIVAGVDESVDISGRGIIIRNPNFPNEIIVIQSGVLALSEDAGLTWKTAITPKHIVAERIMGKLIMGENMIIGDDDGTFEIKGNKLTIKDRQDVIRLLLGEYEDDKFGLKLMNKSGEDVILDETGILQTWQEGRTDNVDTSNGLSIYIYLPDNTISVREAILNFKLLNFRSYSRATESGGASTQTSSSGGGTTATSSSGGGTTATSSSGGGVSTSTASGGSSSQTSSSGGGVSTSTNSGGGSAPTSSSGGGVSTTTGSRSPVLTKYSSTTFPLVDPTLSNHYHAVVISAGDLEHNHSMSISNHTHTVTVPSHSHNFSISNHSHSVSIPSHTHDFSVPNHTHNVTVPNHSHDVTIPNHTHTVNIPSHSHDIDHGIYTSTSAMGIGIIINGTNRTLALGGKFNTDQSKVNITPYMRIGQWNEIRLTSDRLGRIDANIFIQAFMGT